MTVRVPMPIRRIFKRKLIIGIRCAEHGLQIDNLETPGPCSRNQLGPHYGKIGGLRSGQRFGVVELRAHAVD